MLHMIRMKTSAPNFITTVYLHILVLKHNDNKRERMNECLLYSYIPYSAGSHSENTQILFFVLFFFFFLKQWNLNSVWFLFCLLFLLWGPEVQKVLQRKAFEKHTSQLNIKPPFPSHTQKTFFLILLRVGGGLDLISPSAPLWLQLPLKCLCLNRQSRKS